MFWLIQPSSGDTINKSFTMDPYELQFNSKRLVNCIAWWWLYDPKHVPTPYSRPIHSAIHNNVSELLGELLCLTAEPEPYVTTDGQSARLSWNKAPIWGLWPDFYYHQTVAGLLIWGALSDESIGLSFTTAAGARQRHIFLSQIRDFPYRHLLQLAGLRWRYLTPPPHGIVFDRN
jgi:hypothetical protein